MEGGGDKRWSRGQGRRRGEWREGDEGEEDGAMEWRDGSEGQRRARRDAAGHKDSIRRKV